MEKNVKICLKRRGYTVFKNEANDEYQFVIPFKDGDKRGKVFRCTKDKIGLDDLSAIFRRRRFDIRVHAHPNGDSQRH